MIGAFYQYLVALKFGGDGEIRTLEGLQTLVGFQDRCIQPLCHVSICASL